MNLQDKLEKIKDQILSLPFDLKIDDDKVKSLKEKLHNADNQTNWGKIVRLEYFDYLTDKQDIK